jgi:hypothetical protein
MLTEGQYLTMPFVHLPLANVNVTVAVSEQTIVGTCRRWEWKQVRWEVLLVNARPIPLRIQKLPHVSAAVVVGVKALSLRFALDERRSQLAATGTAKR